MIKHKPHRGGPSKQQRRCTGRLEVENIGGMAIYTTDSKNRRHYKVRCPACGFFGTVGRLTPRMLCDSRSITAPEQGASDA